MHESTDGTATARRRATRATAIAVGLVLLSAAALIIAWQRADDGDGASPVAGPSSTTVPERAAPTVTITEGEMVRGTTVTARLDGLVTMRGLEVDLTITTDGPTHTVSGGDRVGYLGVATTTVDDSGAAVVDLHVPNALSGEDDVIPLVPGEPYLLVVGARDPSGREPQTMPFEVVAADPDTPYPTAVGRGSPECGGPPLQIGFDGSLWVPDGPLDLPTDVESIPGTFAVLDDHTGRFVEPDGTATMFTATAWYYC